VVLAKVIPNPRQRPTVGVQPEGFLDLLFGETSLPPWHAVHIE
jgi:hypothetical protein